MQRLAPRQVGARAGLVLAPGLAGAGLVEIRVVVVGRRAVARALREAPPRRWIVETEPGSESCQLLAAHGYREQHFDRAGDKVNAVFTHCSAAN